MDKRRQAVHEIHNESIEWSLGLNVNDDKSLIKSSYFRSQLPLSEVKSLINDRNFSTVLIFTVHSYLAFVNDEECIASGSFTNYVFILIVKFLQQKIISKP